MHKLESFLENETHEIIFFFFWDTNKLPIPSQTTRPSLNQKEEMNLSPGRFCRFSGP